MGNFDDMKLSVEAMTGGKNTVLLDDRGMPSVMVIVPKMKLAELIKGNSNQETHPGFIVGTEEKNAMYVSKFQNIVYGDRAYSLPFKDPRTSVNFDDALRFCRNKGKGWSLMPYSLWCAIALWCKANKTMPHGNNNWGSDSTAKHERGVETCKEGGENEHKGQTARTATGSGPDTWNHNWMPDGIADLNGNVWEWTAGMRLNAGEINIIANADVMKSDVLLSAGSTSWKAISKEGNLVNKGTSGCLKWDWDNSGNKLKLTNGAVTFKTDEGHGHSFKDMTLDAGLSSTVPELAKALLLYPDDPGQDVYGGDWHWANVTGERLPICGGRWNHTGGAGVFYVSLGDLRTSADGGIGFRSAFCNL